MLISIGCENGCSLKGVHMAVLLDGHKTQDFNCLLSRFERYAPEIIDGQLHIVAVKARPGVKAFKVQQRNRTELLQRFLRLYESLTPGLYGNVSKRITEQDLQIICNWCAANGTPIAEQFGDDSLWMKYKKVGFPVETFYNRLHDLYTCYLLWRRIYMHDETDSNYYAQQNVSRDECISHLAGHYASMNINLRPDFSVDPPTYNLWCDDLLAIAKAQLFFECMQSDYYSIGVCSVCGRPFARTRKNNMLCEECQRTKYKRTRERQRMSANIEKTERKDANAPKGKHTTGAR